MLLPCVSSLQLIKESNVVDVSLTLTVEKKTLGWHITTLLTNNGDEWIYVEKDGYGDIGCEIYDGENNEVWSTYTPEYGSTWQIGPGATYESFTIWTGTDMDNNKLPEGTYTIIGKAGYFIGNEYVPLETDSYSVEVSNAKAKSILFNNFILSLLNLLKSFN